MQKHLARVKCIAGGAGDVAPGCLHGGCHSRCRGGSCGGGNTSSDVAMVAMLPESVGGRIG